MLEIFTRPIRTLLGTTERDIEHSLRDVRDMEANMLDAAQAIERATLSIEHHVESLDKLATSIEPLRASVDRLADTLQQVVTLLEPMSAAEREISRLGHLFGRHRG